MNRATKRLLAKREAAEQRAKVRPPRAAARAQEGTPEGRIRRWRRFLREVRAELRKVAWPTRPEVATYTVVVLISVTFVTLLVFGLDFAFAKGVLTFFKG